MVYTIKSFGLFSTTFTIYIQSVFTVIAVIDIIESFAKSITNNSFIIIVYSIITTKLILYLKDFSFCIIVFIKIFDFKGIEGITIITGYTL